MDERERRGTGHPRSGSSENAHRRYSDRNTQRSGNRTGPGGKKPRKRSSRARRRRRNTVIRWAILIILILAAVGGFFIWQRYGSSNEEADRGQYYGLEETNDLAVVINNEVIRRKDAEDGSEASPAPGKIYDGQYYIEYSVVRSQINKRFYWDSNENILLYITQK